MYNNFQENRVLYFITKWHQEDIYSLLHEPINCSGSNLSLEEILQYLNDLPFSSLYEELNSQFEWEEIIKNFIYVFENDPSYYRDTPKSIELFMKEFPFSRYIVGICHILVCVFFEGKIHQLREPIWNNMLNRNPILMSPRLVSGSLTKLFETRELLERSVQLLACKNEDFEAFGELLIYMLRSSITSQEILQCIQEKLKTEINPSRIYQYKKHLRKYSRQRLIAKLDDIAMWFFRI